MKRPFLAALILAALFAVILFLAQYPSGQPAEVKIWSRTKTDGSGPSKPVEIKRTEAPSPPHLNLLPQVEMKAVKYEIDFVAWGRERENPPFEFIGGAGTGRIVDQTGKVLIESGNGIGIFGASVAPDKQHILVKGGDAINFVLEPATGHKIQLPVYPPGTNMLGLGDWHWIGPRTLFGSSGVQAFNANGKPVACCEGHNVAQTKLYTFDLMNQQLSEVVLPAAVTQPVVNIPEVMSDGHIHLVHEQPHENEQQDLGWFKIDSSN